MKRSIPLMFMLMMTVSVVGAAKQLLCGPRLSPTLELQPVVNVLTDGLPMSFPHEACLVNLPNPDGIGARADKAPRANMLADGEPLCFPHEPCAAPNGEAARADREPQVNMLVDGGPQCFPEPGGGCNIRRV